MTNSYQLAFGAPLKDDDLPDHVEELASEIFSQFDHNEGMEQRNVESFKELVAKVPALTRNEKAHILDMSFHNANENFYELEDESDGRIDARELQETFLKQVVQALS